MSVRNSVSRGLLRGAGQRACRDCYIFGRIGIGRIERASVFGQMSRERRYMTFDPLDYAPCQFVASVRVVMRVVFERLVLTQESVRRVVNEGLRRFFRP